MKVLLLQNVKGMGQKGDVVEISPGYYRNFLQPQRLAAPANESQVAHVNAQKAKAVEKLENMKESAESVKAKLNGKKVDVKEKASESGKLYAAVSEKEVSEILKKELKVDVPAKQITMETIKEAGEYEIEVELYKGVSAKLTLNVTTAE